jgi:hypothetical protein
VSNKPFFHERKLIQDKQTSFTDLHLFNSKKKYNRSKEKQEKCVEIMLGPQTFTPPKSHTKEKQSRGRNEHQECNGKPHMESVGENKEQIVN